MRRIIPIAIAVVVVAGLGFAGLRWVQRAQAAAQEGMHTELVRRGTLVATVNTAGTVEAATSLTLNFQGSGEVKEIKVKEGDQVKAGQVLACLDVQDAELAVAKAEVSLTIAEAQLAQLKKGATAEEIASARANLISAQENLKALQEGPSASDIEMARLRWEQAKDQLWGAQVQRDAICGNKHAEAYACDQANASVASASMAAEIARIQYEEAQKAPAARDLRAAEAQVAQARLALSKLEQGPTPEEISIAEAQVRQAELALEQARLMLSPVCLTAPFDGTLTHLNLQVGQVVGPTTQAATISGLGGLQVAADLSEIDVARVQAGQEVEVRLDALPDRTFKGQVTEVAPAGTVIQGVVTYPITIMLVESDPAVRPGMTANASIIIERRDDVLLVPARAIRSEDGRRLVRVLSDGQIVDMPVQVGLSGDDGTEILGDTLKEGDTLVISAPTPRMPGMGGARFQ